MCGIVFSHTFHLHLFLFFECRRLFGRGGQIIVLPDIIDGFIFIECQYVCRKMRCLFLIGTKTKPGK